MRPRLIVIAALAAVAAFGALELRHLAASAGYSGTGRPGVCRVATARRVVALSFVLFP